MWIPSILSLVLSLVLSPMSLRFKTIGVNFECDATRNSRNVHQVRLRRGIYKESLIKFGILALQIVIDDHWRSSLEVSLGSLKSSMTICTISVLVTSKLLEHCRLLTHHSSSPDRILEPHSSLAV